MVPIAIRVGIIRTIIRVVICNRIIFLCGYIIGTTTAATSATPTIATYATTSICGIASCLQCFTFASQTTMSFATFGQALHIDIFHLGRRRRSRRRRRRSRRIRGSCTLSRRIFTISDRILKLIFIRIGIWCLRSTSEIARSYSRYRVRVRA